MSTITTDIEAVLQGHGMPVRCGIALVDCNLPDEAITEMAPAAELIKTGDVADAVRQLKSHHLAVALCAGEKAPLLLRGLATENLQVAVIAIDSAERAAELRAAGVMDVAVSSDAATLQPLLRRGLDFAALLQLELAHRCEARRLLNRELELLGEPPEGMSDDLSVFQPPPLPVGPMSIYNLEEASEGFETAYIDRVQQLCSSAREAAVHLGVSSATLSRRLRRENTFDGN